MVEAPIFHVNGDDPEAVVYAAKVATEYRQKFHKPVVIDMFCYRRFGHNEGDEPTFTQPIMYKKIRDHPTTRRSTRASWLPKALITEAEVEKMKAEFARQPREAEYEAGQNLQAQQGRLAGRRLVRLQHGGQRRRAAPRQDRGAGKAAQGNRQEAVRDVPEDFNAHKTIQRFIESRAKMIETGEGIDWATAEALAFGSLCS